MISLLLISFGCSKSRGADPTTESAMFEIYVSTEIYGGEKAFAAIKKYHLSDRENLNRYYEALRTYSTNETKWKNFLDRVEKERERFTRQRVNDRN
jgi:hypothetical protein